MTRELEARLKLTASDRTGKALASVSGKLDAVAKKAAAVGRAQTMMGRASAAATRMMSSEAVLLARALAPIGAGFAVQQSMRRFAETERRLTRIGVTAGATAEQMQKADVSMRRIATDVAMPIEQVRGGLDVLTAAGKSLGDAMSLLPAVARTAQASGASLDDVASTAASIGSSMRIGSADMESAFDHLATAGKLGLFELKDMAQYLPSLAPAFAAVGYEGVEGLTKASAMLQIIRSQTGDASTAANAMANVLQKLETDQTVKNFGKFGVDLRREMAKARREGKDLLETFLDLSEEAVQGDMSKLPQLFSDAEVIKGMRPLLARRAELIAMQKEIARTAAGAVDRDLGAVKENAITSYDRLANAVDKAGTAFGKLLGSLGVYGAISSTADSIDRLADNLDAWSQGVGAGAEDLMDMIAETPAERAYREKYRALTGREPSEAQSEQVRTMWSPTLRGTTSAEDIARGEAAAARDVAAEGGPPPARAASHAAATTDAVIQAQNAVWGAQDQVAAAGSRGERRHAQEVLKATEDALARAREVERQAKNAAGAAAARDISGYQGGKEAAAEAIAQRRWDGETAAEVRELRKDLADPSRQMLSAAGMDIVDAMAPPAPATPSKPRVPIVVPALLDGRGDFAMPSRRSDGRRRPGDLEAFAMPPRRPKPSAAPSDYTLGSTGGFRTEGEIDAIGDAADDAAGKLERLPEAMNPAAFGAAAQASGTAFHDGLIAEIDRTVTTARERIAELKNMMSFTATPTVNVRVNGAKGTVPVHADVGRNDMGLGGMGVP